MRHGHIKISRKMFDGSDMLWSEPRTFSRAEAWIDLIQMAAWRDDTPYSTAKHGIDILARGEFVASLRFLGERWKWGKWKVQHFLDTLQNTGRIAGHRTGQHGTVYVIANYDAYQSTPGDDRTAEPALERTATGQGPDRDRTKKKQLSSKAVKPASRAADAAGADAGETDQPPTPDSPPVQPTDKPTSRKGEAAPWMGEVARVWREVHRSAPPRGTASALRPAMNEHGAEVVVPRLAVYLRKTSARYINLNTFAGTVMAPDWAPDSDGPVVVHPISRGSDPADRILGALDMAGLTREGMNPAEYRRRVLEIAESVGYEPSEFYQLVKVLKPWDLARHTFEPDRRREFARRLAYAQRQVAA